MRIGNISELTNGLYVSVDWLSFTVKDESMTPKKVVELFGLNMNEFQTGLNGSNGYKSRIRCLLHPISVLYDGNQGMGIHVEISGSAVGYFLECYEKKHSSSTPFGDSVYETSSFDATILSDLLQTIINIGQLTRLDLAIDDLGAHYYSMDELTEIFNDGLYLSKFKKWRLNLEKGKKGTTGHSIYLGSRSSEIMLRVYDKKLEQNSKNGPDTVSQPWVRWEMELHKNRAMAVALLLIAEPDIASISLGILSTYLRLIKRDNDRDTRCSTSDKWESFICDIRKVRIL